jgi:hypothetical protein
MIAISNTSPIQFFTLDSYQYRNADDSFTYTEFPAKGLDFEVGIKRWERFKISIQTAQTKPCTAPSKSTPLSFGNGGSLSHTMNVFCCPTYLNKKPKKLQ